MDRIRQFTQKLNQQMRSHPVRFWVRSVTILFVVCLFIAKRNFWTPDTLFIALLAVAIVFGQARSFMYRFLPFVALLLVYDSFRGIADDLNNAVHYTEMIHADYWLFDGALPTAVLQQWWWHGSAQWYDFYFYFLYTLHFVVPIVLGVIIWKKHDKLYWPFVCALLVLSFSAFITYVVFPAAPPWLASDGGYIAPIHRISSDIWQAMGVTNFSEVYNNLSPNKVAAVPSLHAAYPLLFVVFAARVFRWRRVWWLAVYPVSVWIGIVYLGEHYVVDAILGALYALAADRATLYAFAWKDKQHFSVRGQLRSWAKRAKSIATDAEV